MHSSAPGDSMLSVSALCQHVGLSRQAFYKARKARSRQQVDEEFVVTLVKAERKFQPQIGTRKLLVLLELDLVEQGISLGRDRFFALLGKHDLLVKKKRRHARTTYSRHGFEVYRNLIRNIEPSMPHQVWVSDITYIRTDAGFMYLALITDAYSRKIVGYDISDSLESEGCVRALKMAFRQLPAGMRPIHHSDRGVQYCSQAYVSLLRKRECPISMTEYNHCYENAMAERVNGIIKQEYGLGQSFRAKKHAIKAARQAVWLYNERRPHMSLGYRTPESVHTAVA